MTKYINTSELTINNLGKNYTDALICLMNGELDNFMLLSSIEKKHVRIQEIVKLYNKKTCVLFDSFFCDIEKISSGIHIITGSELRRVSNVVVKPELLRILYYLTKTGQVNTKHLSLLQTTLDQGLQCEICCYSIMVIDRSDTWGLNILRSLPFKALNFLFTNSTIKRIKEYICLIMIMNHYMHAADIIEICGESVDVVKIISSYLLCSFGSGARYFDIFKLAYETYPPKECMNDKDKTRILSSAISTDITENVDWVYKCIGLIDLYIEEVCNYDPAPNKEIDCIRYEVSVSYEKFEVDQMNIKSLKMLRYITNSPHITITGKLIKNENIFYDAVIQKDDEIVKKYIKSNFTKFYRHNLYEKVEPYVIYMTENQKKIFYESYIDWVVKGGRIGLLDIVSLIPIEFRIVKVSSINDNLVEFLEKLIFTEFTIHPATSDGSIQLLIKKAKDLNVKICLTPKMIICGDKNSNVDESNTLSTYFS